MWKRPKPLLTAVTDENDLVTMMVLRKIMEMMMITMITTMMMVGIPKTNKNDKDKENITKTKKKEMRAQIRALLLKLGYSNRYHHL